MYFDQALAECYNFRCFQGTGIQIPDYDRFRANCLRYRRRHNCSLHEAITSRLWRLIDLENDYIAEGWELYLSVGGSLYKFRSGKAWRSAAIREFTNRADVRQRLAGRIVSESLHVREIADIHPRKIATEN